MVEDGSACASLCCSWCRARELCQSPTVPSREQDTKAAVVRSHESIDGNRVQWGDSLLRQRLQGMLAPTTVEIRESAYCLRESLCTFLCTGAEHFRFNDPISQDHYGIHPRPLTSLFVNKRGRPLDLG